MISPELLRRYEYFSGLDANQIATLAQLADKKAFEEGDYIFHEGEDVDEFYLVIDGAVGIVIEVPDHDIEQPVSGQLTGEMKTKDIAISTIGAGMIFGWPGIIPPHEANATAKALTLCNVIAINALGLQKSFKHDNDLAYKMTLKAAQVIRDRLRDLQIESLAFLTS
jgi:CRP-like cAMP-binding protein